MKVEVLNKRFQGVVMLVIAALCFWMPYHLGQEGEAHQRLLVATPEMPSSDFFRDTVVLVAHHDGLGAFGIVVNRQDPETGGAVGGPVDPDKLFTVHTLDMTAPGTIRLDRLGLAYTPGEAFVQKLRAGPGGPERYIVASGYAGWGLQQLAREIGRGYWKVIDYDPELVFDTPPGEIYAIAARRAGIDLPAAPAGGFR